jgi:hypothetical protein
MESHTKDFELIEKADLSTKIKLATQCNVAALHYLRALSKQLGVPIEQITAQHIIAEASAENAKWRQEQAAFDSFRADNPERNA